MGGRKAQGFHPGNGRRVAQSLEGRGKLQYAGCRHGYLGQRRDQGHGSLDGLAKPFLDVANSVGRLLHPSGWGPGHCLIHAGDGLFHHLREDCGTLALFPVFQDVFLGIIELIPISGQGLCLAIHDLPQHGCNLGGALSACPQAQLLGNHVIHDRDDGLETVREFQISGQLLGSGELHFIPYNTYPLLRSRQILDGLDLRIRCPHGVAHGLGKTGFSRLLKGVSGGKAGENVLDLADGACKAVHYLDSG